MFGDEGRVFFLTITVVEYARFFSYVPQYDDIRADSLSFALNKHRSLLRATVFMPSHVHLVVEIPAGERNSDLMRDCKKLTSTKVRQLLQREQCQALLSR